MTDRDELAGEIDRTLYGTPRFGVGHEVVDVVLGSDWLKGHDRKVREQALRDAVEEAASRFLGGSGFAQSTRQVIRSAILGLIDPIQPGVTLDSDEKE